MRRGNAVEIVFWVALVLGGLAAVVALYGRYREVPSFLTGPRVCRLEAGGCQALFRTRAAALVGVPNSLLGIMLYLLLGIGAWAGWPTGVLLIGATVALAMSLYLAYYLIRNQLECRVCWTGHVANLILWLTLLLKLLTDNSLFQVGSSVL